ncbi:HET-domain-containing protein [Apiospora arundinis]
MCLQRSFGPDRLIQLILDDHGEVIEWQLALDVPNGTPYCTLSHCWGSQQPTRLLKSNLARFQLASPIKSLPKTFQDASIVTCSLGLQYIWIDSLCIIQDDPQDWRIQSVQMGSVYQSAACNIAATWASGGSDGCFSTRSLDVLELPVLTLNDRPESTMSYKIANLSRHDWDITEAPLNKRGWVVQERYLANRQLSFTKLQVYWECQELVASEQWPSGEMNLELMAKPTLQAGHRADMRENWNKLVATYSSCQLTYQSDKLPAISGMVRALQDITGDVCVGGLWKNDLAYQLCWKHDVHPDNTGRTTTAGRAAPTWSWANFRGPVAPDEKYPRYTTGTPYVAENPTEGEACRAQQKLTVKGMVLLGQAEAANNVNGLSLPTVYGLSIGLQEVKSGHGLEISWDEHISSAEINPERWPEFTAERSAKLLFLIVWYEDPEIDREEAHGLVLRKVPTADSEHTLHVRMGAFELQSTAKSLLCEMLTERLGPRLNRNVDEWVMLSDARLADLVQIVTIV